MINKTIQLTIILSILAAVSACNTIAGIGEDVSSAASAIKRTAEDNKPY